jgi:hypothetical protein
MTLLLDFRTVSTYDPPPSRNGPCQVSYISLGNEVLAKKARSHRNAPIAEPSYSQSLGSRTVVETISTASAGEIHPWVETVFLTHIAFSKSARQRMRAKVGPDKVKSELRAC